MVANPGSKEEATPSNKYVIHFLEDTLPESQFESLHQYLNVTKLYEITEADLRTFLRAMRKYNTDYMDMIRDRNSHSEIEHGSVLGIPVLSTRIKEVMPKNKYLADNAMDIWEDIADWRRAQHGGEIDED